MTWPNEFRDPAPDPIEWELFGVAMFIAGVLCGGGLMALLTWIARL